MRSAARVMLLGMVLVVVAVALYVAVDWTDLLARYPHYLRGLKYAVAVLLRACWYWSFAVPILLLLVSAWRFARAAQGRAAIVWKLFAFATLWGIGSVAFFFALFLAYAPGASEGGTALLAPGVVGCLGYIVIGMGFVLAATRD